MVEVKWIVYAVDWEPEDVPFRGSLDRYPEPTNLIDMRTMRERKFETEDEANDYAESVLRRRSDNLCAIGDKWLARLEVRKVTTEVIKRYK